MVAAAHAATGASCSHPGDANVGPGFTFSGSASAASITFPLPHTRPSPALANLQEQHYRLQAQLARIENEAEALQWQRQQQQHEARQLCRNGRCRAASPEAAVAVDESSREGRQQAEGAPQQPAEQARQDSSVAGSAVGERHDSAGSLPTDSDAVFGSAEAAAATAGQHNGSATEQLAAAAAAAAAEALGEPTVGMYGEPPPHEAFDDLLARFQAQVRVASNDCSQVENKSTILVNGLRLRLRPALPSLLASPLCSMMQLQVNKVKDFLAEQRLCNHNPSGEPGQARASPNLGDAGLWMWRPAYGLAVPWWSCYSRHSGSLAAALVLSTATRGQLFALMQESLGICRDLLRVGECVAPGALSSREGQGRRMCMHVCACRRHADGRSAKAGCCSPFPQRAWR